MANAHQEGHRDAGKSSFDLINPAMFFHELELKRESTFLDLGCGIGSYSIAASEIIGNHGVVYAVDRWEEGVAKLQEAASIRGINNIKAMVGDISDKLPIEKDCIDVCLMAAVLHGLVQNKAVDNTFREIARVLNIQGLLAIIEFKKIADSPGPPIKIRLTPEEIEEIVIPYGFRTERVVEVGPYNYLITFFKTKEGQANNALSS